MTEPTPPPDLAANVEELAALVHDAWVEHRLRAGWRYGEHRSENELISPALVPYDRLPEAERELDRISVRATLGGLTKLGYRLEREGPKLGVQRRLERFVCA